MRPGIKLVMSAATLVVVGVAVRASAEPHPAPDVVSSVQAGRPRQLPTRPPTRSGTRTPPPSRPSPTVHPQVPSSPSARRPTPSKSASVTVAGDVVQTQYGPVQVEISVRAGQITQARALARPTGDGQTDSINGYAVPQLDQETLTAQSARIDTVSGATFTSGGYRQSLQSALDAAHRAGAR